LIGSALQQQSISSTLMIICIACVPIMLLFKPFILNVYFRGEEARVKKTKVARKSLKQEAEDEGDEKPLVEREADDTDW
jgi:hypothetical protein